MLPPHCAPKKECETRFGTINDVVQNILKYSRLLRDIYNDNVLAGINKLIVTSGDHLVYPGLNAVLQWFLPIRNVQTSMDAANKPTTFDFITMFCNVK